MTQPDPTELSHDALVGIVCAYPIAIDEFRAEISRLNAKLAEMQRLDIAKDREIARLNSEVTRLRIEMIDRNDRRNKSRED